MKKKGDINFMIMLILLLIIIIAVFMLLRTTLKSVGAWPAWL